MEVKKLFVLELFHILRLLRVTKKLQTSVTTGF